MFVELGAALVDTDRIAREVVAPGQPALKAIREKFGPSVLRRDGTLDRAAMRKRIFSDAGDRAELEHLLHPLIRERTLAEMDAAHGPYVIAAVPLLFENGFDREVDRVLVVHCTRSQQIERLVERDGVDADEAAGIIEAQIDEKTRLDRADDVIDNTGTLENTRLQVARLHEEYMKVSRDCRAARGRAE
jgi:dephospho-CoA kinase